MALLGLSLPKVPNLLFYNSYTWRAIKARRSAESSWQTNVKLVQELICTRKIKFMFPVLIRLQPLEKFFEKLRTLSTFSII